MAQIFSLTQFQFPYKYRFPGQASNERILFVTRENRIMLRLRLMATVVISLVILLVGWWLSFLIGQVVNSATTATIRLLTTAAAGLFLLIGWWWVTNLWRKSLCLVTTHRLTKFIYTTPINRHTLSLPLEMIVDTGSYTKGFIQAWLKLGVFTARSSATSSGVATDNTSRINKKYYYIENVSCAEDLQQYINKLLSVFRQQPARLDRFRPFIPHLKGKARKKFMEDYPQFWS